MGILEFLKPPTLAEPVLGTLVRRGGYWRGEIKLDAAGPVPLVLAGPRSAPDASSVTLARELPLRYPALRPAIERALFEHYEPYAEAAEGGQTEQLNDVPRLSQANQVWNHVFLVRILIAPLNHVDTVEIAYEAAWDVEHMLGARFQGWVLVELNGSVI